MILGKVRYLILVWNIFILEVESAAEDSDLSGGIKPFRFEPYLEESEFDNGEVNVSGEHADAVGMVADLPSCYHILEEHLYIY